MLTLGDLDAISWIFYLIFYFYSDFPIFFLYAIYFHGASQPKNPSLYLDRN